MDENFVNLIQSIPASSSFQNIFVFIINIKRRMKYIYFIYLKIHRNITIPLLKSV